MSEFIALKEPAIAGRPPEAHQEFSLLTADCRLAYKTDGISCDCEAAMLGGDPVCLHRAAYWYAQGVLELDPEPEPPASAAPVICFRCRAAEAGCSVCGGAGVAPLGAQAAALRDVA
jgi:hypothetical protein